MIVAAISPYREDRELAREEIQEFVEVWCKASIDACADARLQGALREGDAGEITNLTGVNDPYEEPEDADLVLDTEGEQPEQSAERVMECSGPRVTCPELVAGRTSARRLRALLRRAGA